MVEEEREEEEGLSIKKKAMVAFFLLLLFASFTAEEVITIVAQQITSNSTTNFWNLSGSVHLFPNDLSWNLCLGEGCIDPITPLEITGNITMRGGNLTIQGQETGININSVNTWFDNGTCMLQIGRTGSVEIC